MLKDHNQLEHPISLYIVKDVLSECPALQTTILFTQTNPSSKALNVLLGPLFDVFGYAFAAAAVLAPFSGFNIVTGI